MRKKLLCTVLAMVTAAAALGGCGRSKAVGTDASAITIWHDKEDAVAQVLQKQLDQLAPEITVKLERKSDLTEALKMVGNDPKAAPDMYFLPMIRLVYTQKWGFCRPLLISFPGRSWISIWI